MTNQEVKSVSRILKSYTCKEESKLERLKRLDKNVKNPIKLFAYILGIIGSLILGTGMCSAMQVLTQLPTVAGVIIGTIGILTISINYPLYKRMLKDAKNKHAEEIINLSNEILNQKGEN